ncbi:MAG TPA: peptide chain release factor 3 [Burkholderiales bacterium]|nr:peptide chain release factor 3 [Burkholderiales bacterium]
MSQPKIAQEVARRRTFAIISHPDAGKTTLTEKLLLFSGAIHIAGTVKAKKSARHATSDWMEIEKQRGISVASSVMQMEYRDCVVNLLDTPGHQDFSEDTYRVLTAVDAALMVIDAGKGIEPQTLRLLKVCRARNTPVMTFVNKMDRDSRPPLELVDEIESTLGMAAVPFTWPIGMGKQFQGVIELGKDSVRRFGEDEISKTIYEEAKGEVELVRGAGHAFERELYLAGKQTPVFFGSALNDFGVQEVLDALVDHAPPPRPRQAAERLVEPDEAQFAGVVFKIQANMDPGHRDRIAFVRICSGRFERGMRLVNCRSGKDVKTSSVVTFLSQRRDIVDEAYAGDIVGIPNRGTLNLGDTLTEGEALQFRGLPFFAPEVFRKVELTSSLKSKQLKAGLAQLGEEGAIQIFHPLDGSAPVLGAVGQLQFEVAVHRLAHEYGAEVRLQPVSYYGARWVSGDPAQIERLSSAYPHLMARDAAGVLAFFAPSKAELEVRQERFEKLRFHTQREYTGLEEATTI